MTQVSASLVVLGGAWAVVDWFGWLWCVGEGRWGAIEMQTAAEGRESVGVSFVSVP